MTGGAHRPRRIRRRLAVATLLAAAALGACAGSRPPASSPSPGGAKIGSRETGLASWYGPNYHGRTTASGERYNMFDLTAAHKTLPFGTHVLVTHLGNGKRVVVRINDRGPFKRGRIIDLSYEAAKRLGINTSGTAKVRIEVVADPGSPAGGPPAGRGATHQRGREDLESAPVERSTPGRKRAGGGRSEDLEDAPVERPRPGPRARNAAHRISRTGS